MNDEHPAAGVVGLHEAVRLADLVEAEGSHRLDVEPAGSDVCGDLLQPHVGERKAWSAEYDAAEEGQVDAARQLQQRVEVACRIESTEPTVQRHAVAALDDAS